MVEYINKKKIIDKLSEEFDILVEEGHMPEGYLTALSLIETIQAEDVVPLVRCKDCKHADAAYCHDHKTISKTEVFCLLFEERCKNNFYCADGEMREK